MLVIKRKTSQSIKIGDDIEITVVKIGDNAVKLAIDAPKGVTILRKELIKEVISENKEAAEGSIELLKDLKF